jgi:hypothetical protein
MKKYNICGLLLATGGGEPTKGDFIIPDKKGTHYVFYIPTFRHILNKIYNSVWFH